MQWLLVSINPELYVFPQSKTWQKSNIKDQSRNNFSFPSVMNSQKKMRIVLCFTYYNYSSIINLSLFFKFITIVILRFTILTLSIVSNV